MAEGIKIAVIITCYNYENYVSEAIESVLAQTRPADEIIVVNDGSTDGSDAAISRYADRVVYINQENSGQSAAQRAGFLRSTAGVIQFLDADDRLLPQALAEVESHWGIGVAKVQFGLAIIDSQGRVSRRRQCHFPDGYNAEMVKESFASTGTYVWPVTSGNAYARELVTATFVEPLARIMDGVINSCAPLYGDVITCDKLLGHYRLHSNNISRDGSMNSVPMPDFAKSVEIRQNEIEGVRGRASALGQDYPNVDPLDHEITFVNYRLILKKQGRIGRHSAFYLWRRGLVLSVQAGGGAKAKMAHLVWFTVLALAPRWAVGQLLRRRFGRAVA